MSLFMSVRLPNGGALLAADSAASATIGGEVYRIDDMEEHEKMFSHPEAIVFCSGDISKCRKIREYIMGMPKLSVPKIQKYAQTLFGHTREIGTGIIIYWLDDGSMVGMLSAQDFEITTIPWMTPELDFFTCGFHQEEAGESWKKHFAEDFQGENPHAAITMSKVYNDIFCEEVGGTVHLMSRKSFNDPWVCSSFTWDEEPRKIRRMTSCEAKMRLTMQALGAFDPHCVVYAKDFLLLGEDGGSVKQALTEDKSKIRGDVIDARGINIIDKDGHPVLYIDDTGIHWSTKYSPFKYQYATSASGPWHDTRTEKDEYRRESTDGGTTWSEGIKFVARDGHNGSDASVTFDNMLKALKKAADTETSFITANEVGAPTIYGAKIYGAEIYAGGVGEKGGQVLTLTDKGINIWNGSGERVLTISENDGNARMTTGYGELQTSAWGLYLHGTDHIIFEGLSADFSRVKEVKGIHYTLA